jgi:hypothetical protein
MLKWLSNLEYSEKVGLSLVKKMFMEHDFRLEIDYELELYRENKTDLTCLSLFSKDNLIMKSYVKSGKVLSIEMLSILEARVNDYGENLLLQAIENFNIQLRYLVIETQNKGDQE